MPPKHIGTEIGVYILLSDGTREQVRIKELEGLTMPEAEEVLLEYNFVRVIRCKDCTHWHLNADGRKHCKKMNFSQNDPDFYCRYAESRIDDAADYR